MLEVASCAPGNLRPVKPSPSPSKLAIAGIAGRSPWFVCSIPAAAPASAAPSSSTSRRRGRCRRAQSSPRPFCGALQLFAAFYRRMDHDRFIRNELLERRRKVECNGGADRRSRRNARFRRPRGHQTRDRDGHGNQREANRRESLHLGLQVSSSSQEFGRNPKSLAHARGSEWGFVPDMRT
jgi:hypothetical protein